MLSLFISFEDTEAHIQRHDMGHAGSISFADSHCQHTRRTRSSGAPSLTVSGQAAWYDGDDRTCGHRTLQPSDTRPRTDTRPERMRHADSKTPVGYRRHPTPVKRENLHFIGTNLWYTCPTIPSRCSKQAQLPVCA